MKDSQLIETLRTLSKTEMARLIKFSGSPYCNKGRNFAPLMKELNKFHPSFSSEKLTKEYLYARLYPGKRYNHQVIKNQMTGIIRIAEEYLLHLNISRDKVESKLRLAEELQSRRLYRSAGKMMTGVNKEFNDVHIDSFYFNKMKRIILTNNEQLRYKNDIKRMTESTKKITSFHFLGFFTELAFMMHELRTYEVNMNLKFDNSVLLRFIASPAIHEMTDLMKKECGEFAGAVEIYRGMMKLIADNSDEAIFKKTFNLFVENITLFSRTGRHQLLIFLLAASTRLESVNKEKYRRITFELMKLMMETESYSAVDGLAMNIGTFRNIIVCSISLNELNWCETFLKDHIDKLLPEHRDNMYNFSFARLSFERRQFDESLEYLSKVKLEMFSFRYDVKVLLLKVYYELGFFEQAHSLIDTFKHFISENKQVSPGKRGVHQNFLEFTLKLLKMKEGKIELNPSKLKGTIQSSTLLIGKSWLIAKIKEFEGNK